MMTADWLGSSRARCFAAIGLVCCGLVCLTACTLTAPVTPPTVELPVAFSADGPMAPTLRWWQDFHDPQLNTLIERALVDNVSLAMAWSRLRAARAVAKQNHAARWPSIDAQADSLRQIDSTTDSTDRYTLGWVANYELDLWGRLQTLAQAARFDALASEQALPTAAIALSAEVASTWYALVEARGQRELLVRQSALNEQVLELVVLRFRVGKIAAADVLRQRQLVEQLRGEQLATQARIGELEHALAVLLGQIPRGIELPQIAELIALPALPSTGIPAVVLQRRPDVRQARLAIHAANARVGAALAERFPRIDLTVRMTTNAISPAGLFDQWLTQLTTGLLLPVFAAGRRGAAVEQRRAELQENLDRYREVVLTAIKEVEDALVNERMQRQRLASLQRQLALANEVVVRLRQRYVDGSTAYLDVLDALLNQQQLERQVLTQQRELLTNRIALARALAGGWTVRTPVSPAEVEQAFGREAN